MKKANTPLIRILELKKMDNLLTLMNQGTNSEELLAEYKNHVVRNDPHYNKLKEIKMRQANLGRDTSYLDFMMRMIGENVLRHPKNLSVYKSLQSSNRM